MNAPKALLYDCLQVWSFLQLRTRRDNRRIVFHDILKILLEPSVNVAVRKNVVADEVERSRGADTASPEKHHCFPAQPLY